MKIPYYFDHKKADVFNQNVSNHILTQLAKKHFKGKADGIIIHSICFYSNSESYYIKTNKGRFAMGSEIFTG